MKDKTQFKGKLSFIKNAIESNHNDVAVKEICTLFEIILRKIYVQALSSFDFYNRNILFEAEKQIGKNKKGVSDFGLGELIGLFSQTKLLAKWGEHAQKDLSLIKEDNLNRINDLRIRCVHKGEDCEPYEAEMAFAILKSLLATIGYSDLTDSIYTSSESMTSGSKLELVERIDNNKAYYDPTFDEEKERLSIQNVLTSKVDYDAFFYVFNQINSRNKINGLDVGCAYGDVTFDRFGKFINKFEHIIGIDKVCSCVEEANANNDNPETIVFYEIDIESDNFDEVMQKCMDKVGIDSYDFVFVSYTLHHIKKPIKVLKRLRKYMSPNSFIIIKTADDGPEVLYPDDDSSLDEIKNITYQIPGSDRKHGRKIYDQLKKSGFKDIKMLYHVLDNIGKDYNEKEAIFNQSFSHRLMRTKKALENDPDNILLKNYSQQMQKCLDDLEMRFADEHLYYSEVHYAAVARKG